MKLLNQFDSADENPKVIYHEPLYQKRHRDKTETAETAETENPITQLAEKADKGERPEIAKLSQYLPVVLVNSSGVKMKESGEKAPKGSYSVVISKGRRFKDGGIIIRGELNRKNINDALGKLLKKYNKKNDKTNDIRTTDDVTDYEESFDSMHPISAAETRQLVREEEAQLAAQIEQQTTTPVSAPVAVAVAAPAPVPTPATAPTPVVPPTVAPTVPAPAPVVETPPIDPNKVNRSTDHLVDSVADTLRGKTAKADLMANIPATLKIDTHNQNSRLRLRDLNTHNVIGGYREIDNPVVTFAGDVKVTKDASGREEVNVADKNPRDHVWFKVNVGGQTGWMSAEYLTAAPVKPATVPIIPPTGGANVPIKPPTNGTTVTITPPGAGTVTPPVVNPQRPNTVPAQMVSMPFSPTEVRRSNVVRGRIEEGWATHAPRLEDVQSTSEATEILEKFNNQLLENMTQAERDDFVAEFNRIGNNPQAFEDFVRNSGNPVFKDLFDSFVEAQLDQLQLGAFIKVLQIRNTNEAFINKNVDVIATFMRENGV